MASTADIHALRVLGHNLDALAIAVLAGDSVRTTIATARLRRAAYRACRAADQAGVALLGPYIDKTVQPMLTLASLMPMAPETYACGLDAEQDESPHLVGLQGSHADLHDTSWRSLHVVDCALDGASLRGAVFDNAVLEGCNVTAADLVGASWRWSRVTRCALAGARLTNAILEHARFVDCDFRGADFSVVPGTLTSTWRAAFVRCDLRDSVWHARDLAGVMFIDCKLAGARADSVADGITLADAARPAAKAAANRLASPRTTFAAHARAPRRDDLPTRSNPCEHTSWTSRMYDAGRCTVRQRVRRMPAFALFVACLFGAVPARGQGVTNGSDGADAPRQADVVFEIRQDTCSRVPDDPVRATIYALEEYGRAALASHVKEVTRGLLPLPGITDPTMTVAKIRAKFGEAQQKTTGLGWDFDEAIRLYETGFRWAAANQAVVVKDLDTPAWMTEALVGYAKALARAKKADAAKDQYWIQFISFPDLPITESRYGPTAAKLYDEARKELDASPHGTLLVTVNRPDATIFINYVGRGRGGNFQANVVAGTYEVLVEVGGKALR